MRPILLLFSALAVLAQSSDGDNLETFPSIVSASTSFSSPSSFPSASESAFNPSLTLAPGPAVSPSSYLSSIVLSSSSLRPNATKTLVSASSFPSSPLSTSLSSASEEVVTSTVGGSVTTVTITNSASGSVAPASGTASQRSGAARGSAAGWLDVGSVVAVVVAVSVL